MSILLPDGANQTANGAEERREGSVSKAEDRVLRAGASWETVVGLGLAIERGERKPVADVESLWLPVQRLSLAERADAATKAQDIPWRDKMTDIWQFSADRVDRMESNRADDTLNASLAVPFQVPQANEQQPPA